MPSGVTRRLGSWTAVLGALAEECPSGPLLKLDGVPVKQHLDLEFAKFSSPNISSAIFFVP
jgi:hypothetical protein